MAVRNGYWLLTAGLNQGLKGTISFVTTAGRSSARGESEPNLNFEIVLSFPFLQTQRKLTSLKLVLKFKESSGLGLESQRTGKSLAIRVPSNNNSTQAQP